MSNLRPSYLIAQAPRRGVFQRSLAHFSVSVPSPKSKRAKAEIAILADDVGARRDCTEASALAVATITAILQNDNALPVLRRLVEALRQANTALFRKRRPNWGTRLIAAVLIGRYLYVACVGNMQAYLIRNRKPYLLTDAGHTRRHYLGKSIHTPISYRLQQTPGSELQTPTPTFPIDVQFCVEPNDVVLLCSGGLDKQWIQTAACQHFPGRIADQLIALAKQHGRSDAKAITLHWHPQPLWRKARRTLLILALLMLGVLMGYGSLPTHLGDKLVAQQRLPATVAPVFSAVVALVSPSPIATNTSFAQFTPMPTATASLGVAVVASPIPTQRDDDMPITPSAALIATVTATHTPTNQPTNTPTNMPTSTPTLHPTHTPTNQPTNAPTNQPTNVPANSSTNNEPPPGNQLTAVLLGPEDGATSANALTFAWQAQGILLPGQAFEVIAWRPDQDPMRDGLGLAAAGAAVTVPVNLAPLEQATILSSGVYHWGVLLVTLEPYQRIELLAQGRHFRFEPERKQEKCDPDREVCS